MKQFNNLMEAVSYHDKCYVCGSKLIHNLNLNPIFDGIKTVYKWNLSESIDSETDDYIIVDAYYNNIEYCEQVRKNYNDPFIYEIPDNINMNSRTPIRRGYSTSQKFYGTLYESIHVDCGKCYEFGYLVKVIIDLTNKRLSEINLYDEFIVYKDEKQITHKISNVYALERTEYSYNYGKIVSVPLVPLNLSNPAETIARIKKLVIFS